MLSVIKHHAHNCHVNQVCVEPHSSAINMTLPAFAAEHRPAAQCCWAPGTRRCRSISLAHVALSSKPTTQHAIAAV